MASLGREETLDRAALLAARPGRTLLGVAGAPGAGKSTLAALIAARVPGSVVVPMDGFHLTSAALTASGTLERRGAPDTFDAVGFVAGGGSAAGRRHVLAPDFDRSVEEPVADVIEVPAGCPLVIVEGNYLLLDDGPWAGIASLLDETWFVEVPDGVRLPRLISRHVEFGRTAEDAQGRATAGPDAANAALVAASRRRADVIVRG